MKYFKLLKISGTSITGGIVSGNVVQAPSYMKKPDTIKIKWIADFNNAQSGRWDFFWFSADAAFDNLIDAERSLLIDVLNFDL